jgi:PAN domain
MPASSAIAFKSAEIALAFCRRPVLCAHSLELSAICAISLLAMAGLINPVAAQSDSPAMQAYDNYSLTGPDISMLVNSDAKACLVACQAEPKCQALSFNKWKKDCSLKSAAGSLRFDPSSVIALPASTPLPAMPTGEINVETIPSTRFLGNDFKSTSVSSFGNCLLACQKDTDCVAFTYSAAEQACKAFQSADGYVADQAVDSGVKQQVQTVGSGAPPMQQARPQAAPTREQAPPASSKPKTAAANGKHRADCKQTCAEYVNGLCAILDNHCERCPCTPDMR